MADRRRAAGRAGEPVRMGQTGGPDRGRLIRLRLAQCVLLTLTVGGALAFAVQMALWPDHPLADMTHIAGWVRNVRREGIENAYNGVYPASYLIYPPGMAYLYQLSGWLAEHVAPPAWAAGGDWLRFCIKVLPVAGHGALALALFGMVAAAGGFWRGWLAAALYAWSPAALFDAAYWGQADSLYALLLALVVAVLFAFPGWWPLRAGGRWRPWAQFGAVASGALAGAFLAAAGLTKPQAWVFLPLLLWLGWRRVGPLGLAAMGAAGAAVAWWIVVPWERAGRMADMLSVFTNIAEVMPSVSANGHNLWWLKIPGGALSVLDWFPVGGLGPWGMPAHVNFQTLGRLGFGLLALLPLLRLTGPLTLRLALASVAYTAAGYFMTITQVHENHLFAAIPFLAAAAALDAWLLIPFLFASISAFGNLALHDFLIGEHVAAWLGTHLPAWLPLTSRDPLALQTANATLNVAGFGIFTLIFLRRPAGPAQSARALLNRSRLVLGLGLLLAGGALVAVQAVLRIPALAARLWEQQAARALAIGPVEAKLGHKTPAELLLARAAMDYANLLFILAAVAAIVGTLAALAGVWWLLCAWHARRQERRSAGRFPAERPPAGRNGRARRFGHPAPAIPELLADDGGVRLSQGERPLRSSG